MVFDFVMIGLILLKRSTALGCCVCGAALEQGDLGRRAFGDSRALPLEFIQQFPPQPLRIPRPKQNPEPALLRPGAGAPFIVHAAEPAQAFEELLTKGRFQPGKILPLRRPLARTMKTAAALVAKPFPGKLTLGHFHASPHEFPRLDRQGQMWTMVAGRGVAEWTISFAQHHCRISNRSRGKGKPKVLLFFGQGVRSSGGWSEWNPHFSLQRWPNQ